VIVDDFDVVRIAVLPAEADPPLIVDPNAVLARAVADQGFRRDAQIVNRAGGVDQVELALGEPLDVVRQLPGKLRSRRGIISYRQHRDDRHNRTVFAFSPRMERAWPSFS
jgi:hypothetical protein